VFPELATAGVPRVRKAGTIRPASPGRAAGVCGALAILIGMVVLVGWAVHLPLLTRIGPDLPAAGPDAALCLIFCGCALWGLSAGRASSLYAGCALAAGLAAASLVFPGSHGEPMPPAAAFCFITLAAGFVVAESAPARIKSPLLGLTGLAVAAVAAACGIAMVWGNGVVFGVESSARMAFLTTIGLLVLSAGAEAVALDPALAGWREPVWAPLGTVVMVMSMRLGLLRVFAPQHRSPLSSALALAGALLGAVIFGCFVHFALKTREQREFLRAANQKLGEEMLERQRAEEMAYAANEKLGQRVEERTRELEGANAELRREIARRQGVEEDLRRQKEILQTIFDHVPLCINFMDQSGRIQMANREWERMAGHTLEQIERQGLDIYAETYPDPVERQRAKDFTSESSSQWKDFEIRRDGQTIHSTWAVVRLSDGSRIGIGQNITERKTADRELRKQKEILQSIFDHIPLMINFGNEANEVALVNREWERTLGWSMEELLRNKVDMLAENYPDPEYREQVRDFVLHVNGEWRDFKTRVRDGRVIDTSWMMLRLPDGTSIGIGQDITRRKRAEEALRESEEQFRQFAENIRDLFWIKTSDFKRVLYLSPAYESISGRSAAERYRDQDYWPFLGHVHPEDRGRMLRIIENEPDKEFDIEFRIFQGDGSLRWIHDRGFPIRDASGRVSRIAGIASDITERKLAEEALRDSEERFRQLAENINEVFWLRSPDLQQLLYLSPLAEKVCGKLPEASFAKGSDLDMVHAEDRARVAELFRRCAGQEFEIEYRIITKDGNVRWLRDRGFPIRNAQGEIYRVGGVAEDITERKEAEEHSKATSEQLRALSASLQSAREAEATRIAHQIHDDMGGVLTALRWELEALEKMLHEPGDPARVKAAMQTKLAAMLGLTDTTINVVRRIASELRPSILDDLGLMEACEWQAEQFEARTGIECRCDCLLQDDGLGEREATAVFRIFQEALTNILRHAQATRVDIAMKEDGDEFVFRVADNGRGITDAEKFSRSSVGILGMQERAHLIGAEIEISGEKGVGTTLQIRVPLGRSEKEATHAKSSYC
jgi:PAS domain S-box-containing protein